jgi:CRISPR-associated protein Cmr6
MKKFENFYLQLHKQRGFMKVKDKYEISKLSKIDREGKNKNQSGRWKPEDLEAFDFDSGINYPALCERQKQHAQILCAATSIPLVLSPDYRLIVGLGHPSIYETSMTLHHVYGFPYIPATGIKGALRNYVINTYFELTKEERARFPKEKWGVQKEEKALKKEWFCQIFGCPPGSARKNKKEEQTAFIGDVVFFDAYPTQAPNIEMDVMTVHYQDYYGDKNLPPADWQSPNPIPFLTVKDNPTTKKYNKFQFIIGLRNGAKMDMAIDYKEERRLLELTSILLFEALTSHGLGAKTAVGYGYFTQNT